MDATELLGPLIAGPAGAVRRDAPATLGQALRRAAQRWWHRPALQAPSGRWRYAELDAAVDRLAGDLAAAGAGSDTVIAALLVDDAPLAALPFVASRLGATALLLPLAHADPALVAALAAADPAVVVTDAATEPRAERLVARVGSPGRLLRLRAAPSWRAEPVGADHPTAPHEAADRDRGAGHDVVWLTTSGSTGAPKLVRLTERGLLHAAGGYLDVLALDEHERSLAVMPLTYVGPLTAQTVAMPLVGGCLVVAGDRSPAAAADRVAADAITHLDAVPAWLARAASRLRRPTPSWRGLVYGGAPAPTELVAALAAAQPQLALLDAWGLAEASGPVAARRADRDPGAPPGTAMCPWAGVRVRAVDDAGTAVTHTPGELEVAGATVTPGYAGAGPAVTTGGWLPTGDLGAVDADGAVALHDRRRDVVLRGGATVSSVAVEAVVRGVAGVAGVADVAVVAVPDRTAGEAAAAVVVAEPGRAVAAGAVRAHVRAQLGAAAVPRHVVVRDALPLGPTGKVDKRALRADLAALPTAHPHPLVE